MTAKAIRPLPTPRVSQNGRVGVYWHIRPRLGPLRTGAIEIMECPVCVALNHEHGRECKIEATAILKDGSRWISALPTESSRPDERHPWDSPDQPETSDADRIEVGAASGGGSRCLRRRARFWLVECTGRFAMLRGST